MEYTQKSTIFEYLDYKSVIKMMHVDRDYKSFLTPDNLFSKYFHNVRRLDYRYYYESLGCLNDSDDDDRRYLRMSTYDISKYKNLDSRDPLPNNYKELFLYDIQRFENILKQNHKDLENGSTNEFCIRHSLTLCEDDRHFYRELNPTDKEIMQNERFHFHNIVKFRNLMYKLMFP